jgi:hypothetical protein
MEDLEVYVGLSIKVGNVYVICDEVCGNRLGFVWSDKDSWAGQMIDAKDVTICETEEDCERGRLSALHYFEREAESLQARINMGRKTDNLTTLVNELSRCEYWLSRLS